MRLVVNGEGQKRERGDELGYNGSFYIMGGDVRALAARYLPAFGRLLPGPFQV